MEPVAEITGHCFVVSGTSVELVPLVLKLSESRSLSL